MTKFSIRRLASFALAAVALLTLAAAPVHAQEPEGQPEARRSQVVEAVGSDLRIEMVIAMINEQIPNNVILYGRVPGTPVTIMAEAPVEDVLGQIASPHGWVWWRQDNGDYGLADREYYERNVLPTRVVQRVFRPNNIQASELDRAISGLITPNVGSSVADDRTNKLIVNDLPQALERIERFIREIDVQLIVRLFYIRHADVQDIARKIESYKSGPGTIEVDEKTHQIIVTDLLSNIKKMELLIDILDVGPEIIIYDVNNIGIDGRDLEDLQKIIDTIRTRDLLFEVNDKQGVMILEDVPEVHERVEQILAEFDRPVRQVLLQSEILSTSFDRTFSFGVSRFAYAQDLLSAANQSGALTPGQPGIGGFTNIREIFPNLSMEISGAGEGVIGGNYLSNHAFISMQAAYKDSSTRVLLQPRMLVKNQELSKIFVGEEVPFLTTFFDDRDGVNQRSTTTQSTVNSGLRFEVTPSIANSHLIELELRIDNDTAKPEDVPTGTGTTRRLVGRDRQNVETTLQIPSGRTRMIGGLIRQNTSDSSAGVPFLSSLPWVGSLFGTKSTARTASNLMIFITPTVVEEDEIRISESGRRGRSVTADDRVVGQYDLQLGIHDTGEWDIPGFLEGLDPDDILSGSLDEEEETLRQLREHQRRRMELLQDRMEGSYQPQTGVGRTTLHAPADAGEVREAPAPPVRTDRPVPTVDAPTREEGEAPPPPPQTTQNETNYQ